MGEVLLAPLVFKMLLLLSTWREVVLRGEGGGGGGDKGGGRAQRGGVKREGRKESRGEEIRVKGERD